jgi:hypothetical protein
MVSTRTFAKKNVCLPCSLSAWWQISKEAFIVSSINLDDGDLIAVCVMRWDEKWCSRCYVP